VSLTLRQVVDCSMARPMDKSESMEVEYVGPKYSDTDLNGSGSGYIPDTEEEKKLVRKIDMYLLPTMWLMYLLSYMDRTK
jgi:hypothetical protein